MVQRGRLLDDVDGLIELLERVFGKGVRIFVRVQLFGHPVPEGLGLQHPAQAEHQASHWRFEELVDQVDFVEV